MSIEKAPFTKEQVENLKRYQKERRFHPFTCSGDESKVNCERIKKTGGGILIPSENGWTCPCGEYTQNWCHSFMIESQDHDDRIR